MFAENFVKTNFEAQRPHKPKEHLPVDQKVKPLVSIGPWLVCQKSVNGQTRNCRPVMNNNETTCAIHLSSHGTFSQNRRCGSFGSHHDGPLKTTRESEAAVFPRPSDLPRKLVWLRNSSRVLLLPLAPAPSLLAPFTMAVHSIPETTTVVPTSGNT